MSGCRAQRSGGEDMQNIGVIKIEEAYEFRHRGLRGHRQLFSSGILLLNIRTGKANCTL